MAAWGAYLWGDGVWGDFAPDTLAIPITVSFRRETFLATWDDDIPIVTIERAPLTATWSKQ